MGLPVLIAAYSGRALAQSARRAGYTPLVADAFGDSDTRSAASAFRLCPDAVARGFQGQSLLAALDELGACASEKPIGVVLGSGFEDIPKLIGTLDRRYGIIGCTADTVREVKDPFRLSAVAARHGISVPDMRLTQPGDGNGWLVKSAGGSGGGHVRWHRGLSRPARSRRYFQRHISGTPISILAAAGAEQVQAGFSRQWVSGSEKRPFRYGGAVSIDGSDCAPSLDLQRFANALIAEFNLQGLVSFDFIVASHETYLLEINPRPGATLDIFDTADGDLFRAHLARGRHDFAWQSGISRASAILYADRGGLVVPDLNWPEWASDRPMPGATIPAGAPLASVQSVALDADAAESLARKRLDELANLLYGRTTPKV